MWLFNLVGGRKLILPVVLVLGVISISYGMIQYGKNIQAKDTVIQQQDNYIHTRKRIDEAVKATPTPDASAALDWLRKRQSK